LISTVAGGFGGGLGVVAWRVRRPIVLGLSVALLMAMLQDVFRVALAQLGLATDWLYSPRFGGLTYLGALVVFAVPAAASAYWLKEGRTARERFDALPREGQRPVRMIIIAAIALVLVALPYLLGSFLSAVLGRVGLFILMGLGLNIVVGYAGLLDLGYVAFFAVGAYTTGLLTAAANSGSSIHIGMGFFEALPIVIVVAAFTGLLIGAPVLRLRGDYLAIVTLGFGEIARVLLTSDWLKPALGGAQGLIAIPAPSFLGIDFRDPQPFYYLALAFCALAAFVSYRLANSRVGRAWVAMREDEQVAEAMGISTVRYKLLAFATGAAVGGMSGALFAVQIGSLAPTSFNILVSILALAIIILGGMGSIPGVIVGGLFLVGIPGFLTEFEQFQLLIYGAVLIAIMLYRPEGLIPNVRRTRELHEEEILQDAWGEGVPAAQPSTISWEETPT
jgi:branched-chain amino acid transport system permease protein